MSAASRGLIGEPATVAPVAIGVTAALAAAVLMQLPLVWLALVAVGGLIFCGSFIARDAKLYWLAIFLASVPLNITKLFFWSPEDVGLLKREFSIYVNENMVPQLYLADLPLAMLLAIWIADILARRTKVEVPRGFAMLAAFLLWASMTISFAPATVLAVTWVLYEIKLAAMFLWFVNAKLGHRGIRLAFGVMALSLALQSGVVFYSYVMQTGENVFGSLFGVTQTTQEMRVGPVRGSGAAFVFEDGALRRGTGTIGTANLEAKYLAMLLPFAMVALAAARRPRERVAGAGLLGVGLAAAYLTFSRGGFITAIVGVGLTPILLARGGLVGRRSIVMAAGAGLASLAVAAPFLLAFINSRPGFSRSRLDHVISGFAVWFENPVIGVGINNFNLVVPRLAYDGIFAGTPIHNHYLRIAIETGVIGFVLYFGFFAWAVHLAYRLTAARDRLVAATAAACCAALVALAVYFVADLFYDPIIRMQMWVLIGLTAALARLAADAPAAVQPMAIVAGEVPR